MYKFTLLALLLTGMMIRINGQITITATDMPNIGDTIRYSTASPQSAMGYNFAQTGANHTWDFSNLTHASQDVDTFVSVISTPIYYYPSFITNASIARKGESFNMGTFSLTNVYFFYKEATANFSQVGFAAQLSGVPLPTLFSAPDYQYRFPMNYGNADSCSFGFNISIPTLFNYNNQSTRVNQVDGWGTITTPFGAFQALRVKSVITARDSISSDSLPFPIPPTTTVTTEYKWLANGYRMPILTATIRGIGQANVTYPDHYHPATGIAETSIRQPLISRLYPNPANSVIHLEIDPANGSQTAILEITTLTGAKVSEFALHGSGTIDVSDLPPGIYLIRVTGNNNFTDQIRLIKI